MAKDKRWFEKSHYFSLGLCLFVVAAVGYVSYRDWKEFVENARVAENDRALLNQTQALVAMVSNAESGQLGYLLTGDERYLDSYRTAVPLIREHLSTLAQPSVPVAGTLRQLAELVAAELADVETTIQDRRAGKTDEALAVIRAGRGRRTMDEIRAAASRLMEVQQREWNVREARARRNEIRTHWMIIFGAALLAALQLGAGRHVDRLIRKETRQRAVFETTLGSIGDAVIATDPQGRVTFINPVAQSLTGWGAGEAERRPLSEILGMVDEVSREPVDSPVAKVFALGRTAGPANHTLLVSRDGREVPIDGSGAPIRNPDGTIAGVVLVFRDVTDRRRSEIALEASEQHYRLLFDNNPQAMWVYDAETLAFLAVNNAAVHRYGYSREEFRSMTLLDIRPPEDIPALLDVTKVPPAVWHVEGPWRHKSKDGAVFQVEITEHPLQFDGRSACLVLATDITERVRLEELLRQSQKLESIGRLAGGVAHDFNNLLTVINGYSEMILARLPHDSPLREGLSEIRLAGEHAASLTQQLLAFSRKQLVQPAVLNLNDVITDIQKMIRRLIGEDIELVTRTEPDLGHINADVGQIQQVILNLAVNARDAMPDGGTLQIQTANVTFDESYLSAHPDVTLGQHIMLAVTDTGIGMSPEVQARLFEPFFTTKPKGSGTGLGLATVYGMVKQSGGWIWVYSEPGQGTTFKVYLPRTDAPVTPLTVRPKTDLHGRETILLVEDQTDVRTLAVKALEKQGYRVLAACSGDEALDVARRFAERVDLLVTDVIMPGMNGRELSTRLAAERPGLRVLYMSGYSEDAVAHRGVLDSEVAYLQKPFTPQVLAEKVRGVLGASSVLATILLVDDDQSVRQVLTGLLAGAGYAVLEASNGRQALELIEQSDRCDLVICNLVMPEQEGAETIRAIRRNHPSLPVVAISGAYGGEFLGAAARLGVRATLRKPISSDELRGTVRRCLET